MTRSLNAKIESLVTQPSHHRYWMCMHAWRMDGDQQVRDQPFFMIHWNSFQSWLLVEIINDARYLLIHLGHLKDKTIDKHLNKLITQILYLEGNTSQIESLKMKVQILILTSLLFGFHARAMEIQVIEVTFTNSKLCKKCGFY